MKPSSPNKQNNQSEHVIRVPKQANANSSFRALTKYRYLLAFLLSNDDKIIVRINGERIILYKIPKEVPYGELRPGDIVAGVKGTRAYMDMWKYEKPFPLGCVMEKPDGNNVKIILPINPPMGSADCSMTVWNDTTDWCTKSEDGECTAHVCGHQQLTDEEREIAQPYLFEGLRDEGGTLRANIAANLGQKFLDAQTKAQEKRRK